MDERDVLAERFDAERGRLRAVAYRMLGSLTEAEDAVQEAWLRLARSDESAIENLSGWLTTVVGRVCLDLLRARTARREDVRAAQFHEFVAQLLEWGTQGDVAYIPEMRTQIVSARTVAEVVVDIATSDGDPAQIIGIAGPREEHLDQLAAMLVARHGTPVKVQVARNPADPDADMQATGGLLPGPEARLAGPTFEKWLDQQ
jgi:DNA-directed RNA polymerase specialized sigma24 family protein